MQVIVNEEQFNAARPEIDDVDDDDSSSRHKKLVSQLQNLLTITGNNNKNNSSNSNTNNINNNSNNNNNNSSNNSNKDHPNVNVKCQSTNQTANGCIPSSLTERAYFPGISQLLPSLYLSGAGVAMPHILDQLGVSFIVNVAPELPDTPLSSKTNPLYLRVDALDRPNVDLRQHFDEVADMIEQVRQNGGITLVHCVAGVSRSASLCLAYLMKHMGMSLRTAYYHVKAIRPEIRPNSGFFEQLRAYEQEIHGTSSVRMVFYESLNKEIPDVYETEYKAMETFYQRQRKALRNR